MVRGSENGKSKQWIHSSESLISGRVTYNVKFMGKAEVPEPRGMPMVKAALQKLSFSRQLKRSEGAKPPKVELGIGIHSVSISDIKTKETLHSIGLHRVSFCADDKEDKRLFAFIAKLDDNKHYCYGLDSVHQANDITLTIGQAFELAYERFMKSNQPTSNTKKATDMSKKLQQLELENNELRRRIAELESTQQLSQNGNRASSTTPPAQVSSKLQISASPIQFNTENFAIPSRSSPAQVPVAAPMQEAIANHSLPAFTSNSVENSLFSPFPSVSKPVNNSTLISIDAKTSASVVQPPVKFDSMYADMNRGRKKQDLSGQIHMAKEPNVSYVGNSVKKFRNSLQRNMKKTVASEEKMRKTLTSLFPGKITSKKLRKGKNDERERKFALLEDSPASSCSSSRSSTYANLDDVIATLQKMMNNGESTSKHGRRPDLAQQGSFIGEKLATHHDIAQHNYDTIPRRVPKPIEPQTHNASSIGAARTKVRGATIQQPQTKSKILIETEVMNSNDDLSSLSTTTTDSSSRECVYVLQPTHSTMNHRSNTVPSTQQHHPQNQSGKMQAKAARNETKSYPSSKVDSKQMQMKQRGINNAPYSTSHGWPGSNVDTTLRQLGGEEGYMVLSGRRQVENILVNAPMSSVSTVGQDVLVDSTYDNVNRLMEAVREAAARDAVKQGSDPKKILMTPASMAPLRRRESAAETKARQDAYSTSWMEGVRPISTQASDHYTDHRFPSPVSVAASRAFLNNPALAMHQNSSSQGNFSTSVAFQPRFASSNRPAPFGRGMQVSQETDILFSQDQTSSPSTGLTSEDAFNMQPFVPARTITRLPQPPSRKPVKPQGNLWSDDPFDVLQKPSKSCRELVDMQSLSESSDTTPRSRKSDYHTISHPLIRKKHRTKQKSDLKWSKKYFPNGKKKTHRPAAKLKSPTADESLNNAFGRGLVMSEENLTLDSFDPLKQ